MAEGAEVLIGVIAASALMLVVPLLLVAAYIRAGDYVLAALVALVFIAAAANCVRDLRRKRLGWVSGVLLAVWVMAAVFLGVAIVELVIDHVLD